MGDIRLVGVRNPTSLMSSQIVFVYLLQSGLQLARREPSKNLWIFMVNPH